MGVYLLISIVTSVAMGLYGRRVNRSLSR